MGLLPGNQKRITELVTDHYSSLYRFGFRLSGSAADAEDLTQETFCKAQMSLGQLKEGTKAKSWLFSILRNIYLHRLRLEKNHPCVSLESLAEIQELAEPLPEIDPEQLQKALNDLPEVFRTPVILYYFEDFTYRDIAEQMDLPIGTVMSRLARAKTFLRSRLLPSPEVMSPGPGRMTNGL